MAKIKSAFFCQSCGHESPKWLGKCPGCGAWNSFTEEIVEKTVSTGISSASGKRDPRPVPYLEAAEEKSEGARIATGNELDRVLGGGIVPGSVILLGGEPGIGKSTLLLQTALNIPGKQILYVSGEESEQQVGLRARRMAATNTQCDILTETKLEVILRIAEKTKPHLLIVDSIQTMYTGLIDSSAGSVSQIRECTGQLLRFAKQSGIPVILVGHVTKDGQIAGPKLLEHMVDVVLQFEGDRHHLFRIVRALKNRFGATTEIGIYEMRNHGLAEVENPSGMLMSQRDEQLSGTVTGVVTEGVRPLLLETQALVSSAVYGTPQRSATGFDLRRLHMLLAVLEKRCGFRLGVSDVFLNLTGGIRIEDPALDLAVVSAILSSAEDAPVDPGICFSAEVGLTGEIRPVQRIEQRIAEAEKLGFHTLYTSAYNLRGLDLGRMKIKVVGLQRMEHLYREIFG
jgi:DNA repair protein RadA/Sms